METPTSKELDFTEHWINSIPEEVLRGVKIRDEKFKTYHTNSIYEYGHINVDLDNPSCSKYERTNLKSDISSEDKFRSQRVRKKTCKKIKKSKKSKCQLRVAELAVPSKRYCIETWRTKGDTLPIYMVDRLRQITLDLKPIVPINDAIRCFQQNKRKGTRTPRKRVIYHTIEQKKIKQTEMLCAIFGYKITARLSAPRNLTLSSRLTPISEIVNEELSFLLQKTKTHNLRNSIIQKEIANKITNWIADVVEQSAYNLMLEDYKELEEQEGHIWNAIDELVENAILLCKFSSSSSSSVGAKSSSSNIYFSNEEFITQSESEHSDKDRLQELENIILNIIENIIDVKEYKTPDDIKTSQTTLNVNGNYIDNEDQKISSTNLETDIKDLLLEFIDNLDIPYEDEMASSDFNNLEFIDTSMTDSNMENTIQNDLNENNDRNVEISNNNEVNIENESTIDKEPIENTFNDDLENNIVDESIMENDQENNAIKHNFNIENNNEVFPYESEENETKLQLSQNNLDISERDVKRADSVNHVTEEKNLEKPEESDEHPSFRNVTSEDSIKKVKFSDIDIGSGYRHINISGDDRSLESKESRTMNLHLGPRNDKLLSDADEPWPENLIFPLVKATVSVSKSVISLGNILEVEEKSLDPRIVDNNINPNVEVDDNTNVTDTDSSLDYIVKNFINDSLEYNMRVDQEVQCGSDLELHMKTRDVVTETDGLKNPNINLIEKHLSIIEIIPEIFTQNKPSFKAESKFKSTQTTTDKKYQWKESDVRVWCQGLQNVCDNLDIWLDWMNNSCIYILRLNQKEIIPSYDQNKHSNNRKRIKLKTNIDSDAILWKKLSASLQVGLRSYKHYKQSKILQTRSYRSHQPQPREQQCQMERTCTCISDHHVPLDLRVVHL